MTLFFSAMGLLRLIALFALIAPFAAASPVGSPDSVVFAGELFRGETWGNIVRKKTTTKKPCGQEGIFLAEFRTGGAGLAHSAFQGRAQRPLLEKLMASDSIVLQSAHFGVLDCAARKEAAAPIDALFGRLRSRRRLRCFFFPSRSDRGLGVAVRVLPGDEWPDPVAGGP